MIRGSSPFDFGDEGGMSEEKKEITLVVPSAELTAVRMAQPRRDLASLTLLAGPTPGTIWHLEGEEMVIGRDAAAHVSLDDPGLSRLHARLFRDGDGYYIEDLGSTNGTFVAGTKVTSPKKLVEDERVMMGQGVVFKFALQDALEQEAVNRLYQAAVKDPLTFLYNRRYLDERLSGEFAFALRHGTPLSVLMVDIDHFKSVNDTHGHQAGDEVLKSVAQVVQKTVRVEDVAARYGGEEFIVVARGADPLSAQSLAERLRRMVQKTPVAHPSVSGEFIQVTISVGTATRTPDRPYTTVDALIGAADSALYAAKLAGRNRVVSAT